MTPEHSASETPLDAPAASGRPRRLPPWKKALFAVVATLLFFGLLEAGLWVAGVAPVAETEDPFLGFAGGSPLYVPREDRDGRERLVTAPAKLPYFNAQTFPREKPPNTMRVFCLGGSTTYGRPNDDRTSFCGWLRALLPEADARRRYEVINAGGISYASYRLVRVMEELCAYQPDLFVVYTGHNEFLERRTYADLLDTPGWVRDLGSTLGQTRTYALLRRLVGPGTSDPAGGDGAPVLPDEVETMLDRTVGPEAYSRAVLQRAAVAAHFRFNLRRMVAMARAAGARIVLVNPACNLKDMSPFKSEPGDGVGAWEATLVSRALRDGRRLLAAGETEGAAAVLDAALERDEHHADLHYERGRCFFASGAGEAAQAAFQRAVDEDVCPLRATSTLQEVVRAVAADEDVPLLDFVALLREDCRERHRHAVLGEAYFLDHVHPSVSTHRLLALALIDVLQREGVVGLTQSWNDAAVAAASREILASHDERAQAVALRNLAKVLGWAGKTAEAWRLAAQAVERLPDDFDCLVTAGVGARTQGLFEESAAYLRRALAIQRNSAQVHALLGLALADGGDLEGAEQHLREALRLQPGNADVRANLGTVLSRSNRHEEAVTHFEWGVAVWPGDARLHLLLARERAWQGDAAAALKNLDEALALRPNYAEAHHERARLLEQGGQWAEADRAYERVMRLEPLRVDAWLGRGRVLTAAGRLSESRAHHERLVELAPDLPAARAGLAAVRAAQAGGGSRHDD